MGFRQKLCFVLTAMGGPGDHPGMARKAAAGPMDAGSDVVATTSTTIFSSSDSNAPAAPRAPTPPRLGRGRALSNTFALQDGQSGAKCQRKYEDFVDCRSRRFCFGFPSRTAADGGIGGQRTGPYLWAVPARLWAVVGCGLWVYRKSENGIARNG